MASRDDRMMISRKKLFLDALNRLKQDVPKPFAEFVQDAGFTLVQQPCANSDQDLELTERQARWVIREVEPNINPLEVSFPAGAIVVRVGEDTAFKRRSKRAKNTKRDLARAMWDFLLGPTWRGRQAQIEPSQVVERPSTKEPWLRNKILTLRRRNQMFFAADGGTTTLEAIREFLTAERIPFEVNIDAEGEPTDRKENFRIMEPVLLTNSFPIVQAVTDSPKHRYSMAVDFIGGASLPDRYCTAGELTDLWFRVCCADGRMGMLDLAIIGVTGIYLGPDGVPMASCDDRQEAALKMKLLEMAGGYGKQVHSGGLRVLIFHAAKMLYPEARCRFAALTREMVDLVVVDTGEGTTHESDKIMSMIEEMERCGVAVLLVNSCEGGVSS